MEPPFLVNEQYIQPNKPKEYEYKLLKDKIGKQEQRQAYDDRSMQQEEKI